MRHLFAMILILLACGPAHADYTSSDVMPIRAGDMLSTNWLASVKEALPSAHSTGELSFQAATNLLRQESQRGNIAAQGLWGFVVLVQGRSPEDAATGLRLLRNSAEQGFVPAMLNLGHLFEGGEYVQRDYSQAFHWFTKAGEKNNPEGLLQLGVCHHYALGTTRDMVKAVECYRRSSEMTNFAAMKSLGYLLMDGIGVDKDTEAATYWSMRSAKEGGNRRAMYNLGVLFNSKLPQNNSATEAFQWFKRSAEEGDGLASFELARYYKQGGGGVQTNLGAFHYWRLSKRRTSCTNCCWKRTKRPAKRWIRFAGS